MPDAAPFLAAVASDPDDDLPRLVFADWLDEHGDHARAEFIRLQCHTARVGPLDPTWAPAKLREFDLFKANEAKWRPGRRVETSHTLFAHWRRGFPASVDLDDLSAGWMASGGWCNGSFHLNVDTLRPPHVWPAVGPVREVSLSGWTSGSGDILRHERLHSVRSIRLMEWYAGVRPDALENFAAEFAHLPPDHFPELTTLDLDQGELTLHAVESLAAAPCLRTLRRLDVRFPDDLPAEDVTHWQDATRRLFARLAPHLEDLRMRRLPWQLIGLFTVAEWVVLRSLTVEHTQETGLHFYDYSQTPSLTTLQMFDHPQPERTGRTPDPVEAFDTWPEFDKLKVLSLGRVPGSQLRGLCEWMSRHPGCALDFLSAFPQPADPSPMQPIELNDFSATRGLMALSGQFTNGDLAPLVNPGVLPECHTIWSGDADPPPSLRWRGGARTVIPKDPPDAWRHSPTRSHWCGWHDDLFG
jgi:uncharacterized protein (TIGR02996 family)